MNNEFAELVKNARIKNGLSQRELAKMMGVSNAIISRIESGMIKKTNYLILTKLCINLKINYNELFKSANYDYEDIIALQHIDDFFHLGGMPKEKFEKYIRNNEINIEKVKNDYQDSELSELEAIEIFLKYLNIPVD